MREDELRKAAQAHVAANCYYGSDDTRQQLEDCYVAGAMSNRSLDELLNELPTRHLQYGKEYVFRIERSRHGESWSVGYYTHDGKALLSCHRQSLYEAAKAAQRWFKNYINVNKDLMP